VTGVLAGKIFLLVSRGVRGFLIRKIDQSIFGWRDVGLGTQNIFLPVKKAVDPCFSE